MFVLPYTWFVAILVVGVVILAVWSFLPSAPRWLLALRNAILVTVACMVLTLIIVLAVTPRNGTSHNETPETIPPGVNISGNTSASLPTNGGRGW